jgi:hypothetical protein
MMLERILGDLLAGDSCYIIITFNPWRQPVKILLVDYVAILALPILIFFWALALTHLI